MHADIHTMKSSGSHDSFVKTLAVASNLKELGERVNKVNYGLNFVL